MFHPMDALPVRHQKPPLELESVCLQRGGRSVLESVSLSIEAARTTAIVGPSGAGKTSLLRCLNRLEEADEGKVSFLGTDVRLIDPSELRRRVGMIFQTPLIFEGGVRSNLCYGLRQDPGDDALEMALDSAGLTDDFLGRESDALSVGQAQRVCIARALVRGPEVLLMDEPTSALDMRASERIEGLISSLVDQGLTVVLVTHDIDQAIRVAADAALLIAGHIKATGTPEEVSTEWLQD
jgi:putative ABC transport system ATP-binding protein